MSPMSAAFMTVSPAFAAFAAFALSTPSPARGRTPSSITSVRSRQMALCVILLMLFLLLFGFLFLFRPQQLFAADVALVRVRSCHRTAFRAHRVPRKIPFPVVRNVFREFNRIQRRNYSFAFGFPPFLHLFSFRRSRRSPDTASAESAALSGLTAYAPGDDKYKYISVGNII